MIQVVAAIVKRDEKYLVARRKPGKHLAGYFEFPGGKIEENESPEISLERELKEELGVSSCVGRFLGESLYDYGQITIHLLAYSVVIDGTIEKSADHDLIKWVSLDQLSKLRLAPADIPLLEYI